MLRLFALEGPDGIGKSTVSKMVKDRLTAAGFRNVSLMSMPGATSLGQKIRTIVKDKASEIDRVAERFLFAADTIQFGTELEKISRLPGTHVVILDRWSPISDFVYGTTNGVLPSILETLFSIIVQRIVLPDVVYLLRAPWYVTKARLSARNDVPVDRIEARGMEYLKDVSETYDSIPYLLHDRYKALHVIDAAERNAEEITDMLCEHITGVLNDGKTV